MAGPATPSTTSPREAWKRRTAARVIGPYTPSAEIPSARCSAAVVDEGALVTVRGPRRHADPERAGRDRAHDAVDLEPVRGLEAPDGRARDRPELTVGRDPQRALDGGHAFALAAALQHRLPLGDADGHDHETGQQRGRHLRAGHPRPVAHCGLRPPALRAFQ